MAVKGICMIQSIQHDQVNAGKWKAIVAYAGTDSGNEQSGSLVVDNIDSTILTSVLIPAVTTAVKNLLTSSYGYSFGLFDTVRMMDALV